MAQSPFSRFWSDKVEVDGKDIFSGRKDLQFKKVKLKEK